MGIASRAARRGADPGRPAIAWLALLSAAVVLALAGCGGAPPRTADGGDDIPDAVPKVEPKSRFGNMSSYVVFGRRYYTKGTSRDFRERGVASWYGTKFHGRKTSSGEVYDMHAMTAAHKTLPLPSYVRVTNLENGRTAVVKVNDRGPFVGDRVIDLSYAAATKLGVVRNGTARVEIVSVDPRDHGERKAERLLAASSTSKAGRSAGEAAATAGSDDKAAPERATRGSPFGDLPGRGGGAGERAAMSHVAATSHRPEPVVAAREPADAPKPQVRPRAEPAQVRQAPLQSAEPKATLAAAAPDPEPELETPPAAVPAAAPAGAPETLLAAAGQPSSASAPAAGALSPAIYLQVGAFGSRGNAEQLRRKLRGQLSEPILVREPSAGAAAGHLYKVHVGPLGSRDQAAALGRQLAAQGIGTPMVVSQ